ncbi:putative cytochrome P450 [Rosellinia necatrix]|uniref:Putative cytochrome P450 n=1 Tax=Rosellinia necatrix TaxID=77044 RepID=A0A1W2TQH2_ROSNE|nr:putative cytochrome P450 [Rosellinia necatrix]
MDYSLAFARPSVAVLTGFIVLWFTYGVGLVFYRVYLSPLSKFPGPKLAAISKWYEFYYDVVLRGQFTFQIQKMHRKYGPIVRINPFELHVEDSSYWDELYTGHKEYERYEWMSGRFGANTTTSSTVKSDLHAIRRAPLNPMFSKRSITKFEPVIKQKVELLSERIASYEEDGKTLSLNNAFNAFSGDVIASYCFGFCWDQLNSIDFKDNFHPAYEAVRKFAHLGLQFPAMFIVLGLSPSWLIKTVTPNIYKMFALQKDLASKITNIVNGKDGAHREGDHPTIFSELLGSNLPPQEKTLGRLGAEAQQLIGAGLETVAWALTTTVFHLVDNPSTLKKLQAELKMAIPDPTVIPDSLHLERLPYLTGCVREGVRMSTGVSVRLPRVSRDKPMQYKDWVIPAGTPVSMTTLDVLNDDEIFQKPHTFVPERWLDNPKTRDGEHITRYFVPFGKGPRMCIGINLAYVELYRVLATLFRRFEFELYDTDISDVEIVHDFFVPSPKQDTKGLRVKVTSVKD